MANGVLVYGEVRDGALKAITKELVTAATQLSQAGAGPVALALVGDAGAVDAALPAARALPVAKIFVVRQPALAAYSTQGYAMGLEAAIRAADAKVVLFGATALGRDLSARAAAHSDASLFTDCTELVYAGGNLRVKRPVYSGKVILEVESSASLQMASVRPNVYAPAASGGSAETVEVAVTIAEGDIRGRVKETVRTSTGKRDLTEAEVIVSGGRSLKSSDNFKILDEMAEALGATVGASRAAVDAGYAPHSMQVGQTGKVVNPKLYFAVGISGAIQHLVGMRTSKVIVAVNKDENAPIFQKADYGLVGDLFEIVPRITEELKKLRSAH